MRTGNDLEQVSVVLSSRFLVKVFREKCILEVPKKPKFTYF